MITRAVIYFQNGNYEVYFVDENNKRVSQNKKIDGITCIAEIYKEAKKYEKKLFEEKNTPKELF